MKKVLVIGSGGREHALVWQLKQSPQVGKVFCAPGNAGIAADAECVDIKVNELDKLVAFAKENAIDFTVVGPEAPLCDGVVDKFQEAGLAIFGPDKAAAQLEGSKDFAKKFMLKYGIPTAASGTFDSADEACAYIDSQYAAGAKGIVVKADGLAAGKGVLVAENKENAKAFVKECFDGAFGAAGTRVVIEERLLGEEASILALTDGKTIVRLVSSQDHKRIYDRDKGPNTGGMGAYYPAPVVTDAVAKRIDDEILTPFLKGINAEKLNFKGVIFCGLMINKGVPKVLEFNVRFGDPEIQPVLRRFQGDWYDVLYKTATGNLDKADINWSDDAAVSVVIASGGYPGDYAKGKVITGLEEAAQSGAVVFHCGTRKVDGNVVTDGGRVLGVSATGKTIRGAIYAAYLGVRYIRFENMFFRRDIGYKALRSEGTPIRNNPLVITLLAIMFIVGVLMVAPIGNSSGAGWQVTLLKGLVFGYAFIRVLLSFLQKKFTARGYVICLLLALIASMVINIVGARFNRVVIKDEAGNVIAIEQNQAKAK